MPRRSCLALLTNTSANHRLPIIRRVPIIHRVKGVPSTHSHCGVTYWPNDTQAVFSADRRLPQTSTFAKPASAARATQGWICRRGGLQHEQLASTLHCDLEHAMPDGNMSVPGVLDAGTPSLCSETASVGQECQAVRCCLMCLKAYGVDKLLRKANFKAS